MTYFMIRGKDCTLNLVTVQPVIPECPPKFAADPSDDLVADLNRESIFRFPPTPKGGCFAEDCGNDKGGLNGY